MDAEVGTEAIPLGIALGGGAARGLCHIGVLKVLSSHGIEFPVVTGTSMGAIIGSAYVCGKLEEAEAIARSVTARSMSGGADMNLRTGGLKGEVVKAIFRKFIGDTTFEDLRDRGIRFTVVAADLEKEEPIYIDTGSVCDAVRASMSIPGIFEPITLDGRVLVDGGLIDNIPIGAARALGAGRVVAVDVNNPHDIWIRATLGFSLSMVQMREVREKLHELAKEQNVPWQRSLAAYSGMSKRLAGYAERRESARPDGINRKREFLSRLHIGNAGQKAAKSPKGEGWTAFRATLAGLDIITSLLEQGREPFKASTYADVFIKPDVRRFHAHQFYRARQLIAAGERAALEALPRVKELMEAADAGAKA